MTTFRESRAKRINVVVLAVYALVMYPVAVLAPVRTGGDIVWLLMCATAWATTLLYLPTGWRHFSVGRAYMLLNTTFAVLMTWISLTSWQVLLFQGHDRVRTVLSVTMLLALVNFFLTLRRKKIESDEEVS